MAQSKLDLYHLPVPVDSLFAAEFPGRKGMNFRSTKLQGVMEIEVDPIPDQRGFCAD